jgi:putative tryptophan/tyrosine transport system substrate-binding protein
MRRRDFVRAIVGSATAWPLTLRAQQPGRMWRVGLLVGLAEDDPETKSRVRAFRLGLRDADWVEGRNIRIDYRFSVSDPARAKQYAAELMSLAPDVIVGNSTPVITALRQVTSTFAVVNDPMGQGFVSSLAHPGGNVTGFSFIEFPIVGKWIGMLKDVSPGLSRVALMFNPETSPYYDVYLRLFERMPRSIAVDVSAAPVSDETQIEQVIAKLGQEPGSGLIGASDTFIVVHRDAILRSAKAHRVPVVSAYKQFVLEGYPMSYGPDTADIFWRAASYVDRILRGEKAADLPVQSPIKFELFVNMPAVKALGLTVPESFLQLADEVVE